MLLHFCRFYIGEINLFCVQYSVYTYQLMRKNIIDKYILLAEILDL